MNIDRIFGLTVAVVVLLLIWYWRRSRWCSCFIPGNPWVDKHNRMRCGKCNGKLIGGL